MDLRFLHSSTTPVSPSTGSMPATSFGQPVPSTPGGFEKSSVYFFLAPMGPPEMCGYPHAVVALAEGLRILGVPFFANRNHWKEAADSEQTLFVHDPEVGPDDCSVVVLDNCWTYSKSELPALALHRGRRFKSVYFDFEDGFPCTACGEEFRSFDRIFRAHWNYFVEYPSNFEPWVFGPTSRMIRETENAPAFSSRERSVFVSYRIGHPLRVRADHHFIETLGKHMAVDRYTDDFAAPADAYHWQQWHQTGRRHHPEYYRRLKNSQMCACFGGRLPFVETRRESRAYAMVDRLRAKLHVLPRHVVQWDSFRLWESWCAGAAAIHVDLEKYGARLPEMPRNWEHYVGIDFDHPRQAIERVLEEPETVEKVAAQGRAWALENYHPTRIARRFLSRLAA